MIFLFRFTLENSIYEAVFCIGAIIIKIFWDFNPKIIFINHPISIRKLFFQQTVFITIYKCYRLMNKLIYLDWNKVFTSLFDNWAFNKWKIEIRSIMIQHLLMLNNKMFNKHVLFVETRINFSFSWNYSNNSLLCTI